MATSNFRLFALRLRAALAQRGVCALFLTLSVVGTGMAARPSPAQQIPQDWLRQGDKAWNEQSFELALAAYQKALAADPKLPNRAEIEYRLMVSLGRTGQWDQAIAAAENDVKTYRDTIGEACGQVWRERLYRIVDHHGYKVGKNITRGRAVPKSEGGETPEQIDLRAEDSRKAEAAMVRAQALFERFRATRLDAAERDALTVAEIDLGFDLAEISAREDRVERLAVAETDWTIDLHRPYDRRWPSPRRAMYLYEKIMQLDATRLAGDHRSTMLAALDKANYILQLRQRGGSFQRVREYIHLPTRKTPGYSRRSLPYEAIDPIELLLDAVRRYPNAPEADRLAFKAARWTEEKGDFLNAEERYLAFLHAYPKSLWHSDAQGALNGLTRPQLSMRVNSIVRPEQRASVQLNTRNLSQVRLTAYRVHLESIFGHGETQEKGGPLYGLDFNDLMRHFHPERADPAYRAEKVAEWTITTTNNGKHNQAADYVPTPLEALGAYIIEARAGEHDQLGATGLILISDMALVQNVDKDSVLAYVADSHTGKPLAGVKLTVRASTSLDANGSAPEVRSIDGVTDSAGQFRAILPVPVGEEKVSRSFTRRSAQVFAFAGGNRYAVNGVTDFYTTETPQGEKAFRAFVATDRPLYHASQTVNLSGVMAAESGKAGAYHPASGKDARLTVTGPRGELLHKSIKLDEHGAFNDRFTLPAKAEAGDWNVRVETLPERALSAGIVCGTTTFHIREYKRPEFAVTVTPDKDPVRVGEKMQMTIAGQDWEGRPVADAKVHYRVFRAPMAHPTPFRPRLEWVDYDHPTIFYYSRGYHYSPGIDYTYWGDTSKVYREGDLKTDAEGKAHLTFSTTPPKPPRSYSADANPGLTDDQSYTVTAEVVDAARRQVTGQGTARAGATQFHAALNVDRKFLLAGDTLQIEGRTLDANDAPFAATGEIKIYRVFPAIREQGEHDPETGKWKILVKSVPAREELAATMGLTTDAKEGRGFAFWHPDTSADYRIDYVAKDDRMREVTATAQALVYGPDFDGRLTQEDWRLDLVPEFAEYRVGDTARVLVITPYSHSYIWFTESTAGRIVRSRSFFVPGRSAIVDVPISDGHIPNVRFAASIVQNSALYEEQVEVAVPAVHRILALTLTSDRADYRPGEHATFRLHLADSEGRPVQGEVNLGVVDAALLTQQSGPTPDIRHYFYGQRIPSYIQRAVSIRFTMGTYSFSPGITAYETASGATVYSFAPSRTTYERHDLGYLPGLGWLHDFEDWGSLSTTLPSYGSYIPPRTPEEQREEEKHSPVVGLKYPHAFDINGIYEGILARDISGSGGVFRSPSMSGQRSGERPGRSGEAKGRTASIAESLPEDTMQNQLAEPAFWMPAIVTDAQGNATVSFDFPNRMTRWTVVAWGVSGEVQVGFVEMHLVTR